MLSGLKMGFRLLSHADDLENFKPSVSRIWNGFDS